MALVLEGLGVFDRVGTTRGTVVHWGLIHSVAYVNSLNQLLTLLSLLLMKSHVPVKSHSEAYVNKLNQLITSPSLLFVKYFVPVKI